jgi:Uncharacterized protein conserved in bacteria
MIFVLMVASLALVAAPPAPRQDSTCDKARTTLALDQCLSAELARDEKKLKGVEAKLRKQLTAEAKAEFEVAASAWRNYRDHECRAVYEDYDGGSGAAAQAAACKIVLTEQRTVALTQVYMSPK